MGTARTDGTGAAEAGEPITIDRSKTATRWRWGCPNGHTTLEPTNGGVWCRSCARDESIDDPHHYELLDKRRDELVDWARVELVG
jgi:hypothetical protein